jgi:hypothetical protein
MPIQVTPEIGLPIPDANTTPEEELDFREKAHVLCRTVLVTHGGAEYVPIEHGDSQEAARMFATSTIPTRPVPRPGANLKLEAMLTEYDHQVVESAAQLRTYVTNKLIEETENKDAKIRIKALELLGKIGDVGLFAEKIEITVKDRRTDEIEGLLKEKLERFMGRVVHATPEDTLTPTAKPLHEIDFDDVLEGGE